MTVSSVKQLTVTLFAMTLTAGCGGGGCPPASRSEGVDPPAQTAATAEKSEPTARPEGAVLPFPEPPMGGKVGETMQTSVHKWRKPRPRPPHKDQSEIIGKANLWFILRAVWKGRYPDELRGAVRGGGSPTRTPPVWTR